MTTPARKQYLRIKKEHPGAILLFRMGDFYETFDDDARVVSKELEIALTSREMGKGQRIPLAGIPYHSIEGYLARLIRKGYKVAICEQTSDPAASKGLVDREVVRVVTPGTVVEPSLLDQKSNNYLSALVTDGQQAGLAFVDITTGEFGVAQLPLSRLQEELVRLSPSELLVPEGAEGMPLDSISRVSPLEPHVFDYEMCHEALLDQLGVISLEAFGCAQLPLAIRAAGAVLDYLGRTQKQALKQITSLYTYHTENYMLLDAQTRRNLEIFEGARRFNSDFSLLAVLDMTKTPMGGRLLRRWLGQPLLDFGQLLQRQEAVAWMHRSALRRERVILCLKSISDIERLINRVRSGIAIPRDLVALGRSLEAAPNLKAILEEDHESAVAWLHDSIKNCKETAELINVAIVDDPPLWPVDGGVMREGFSQELDQLRKGSKEAAEYIAGLEKKERERSGIKSLKVGYNRVFGYYIEVSNANLASVPDDYIRKQTLVGGERYITPELKEYESLILNAQERIGELETQLFKQVCQQVAQSAEAVLSTASAVAHIDVFCSLAEAASRNGYVRPKLTEGDAIEIKEGRHPVVERTIDQGTFGPNDTYLSNRDAQLIILTGPNMSGKSTFIRQAALIVLMAQIGSFVPAQSASLGLVDRIFTRIGLQDDLALGHSTFMVEMVETAAILNHATSRSLIILDEIGRGTSTYDGLAIARSVAEYIHNHPRLGCKTLFATHYHELTELANYLPRTRNHSVAVAEDQGKVVFLHRIVAGVADKSYGVHVAQLAGLPRPVIARAWEVLNELEGKAKEPTVSSAKSKGHGKEQLSLFGFPPEVMQELQELDVTSMTPMEAINKLFELQAKARQSPNSKPLGEL